MIEKDGVSPHNGRKHLPMNLKITADDRYRIVYDADKLDIASAVMFRADYWGEASSDHGSGLGRGGTRFLSGAFGDVVLKRYLRGGQMARWNRDLYLYLGTGHSRPFREFRLLAWMYQQQLPVPAPIAALVERHGLLYRGALITAMLPETPSLAESLQTDNVDSVVWRSVGRCIRRFHDAGVMHADLNVNNILVDGSRQVYLVDFDKSYRRKSGDHWKQANLYRLKRSLIKLRGDPGLNWPELESGYSG